MLRTAHRIEAPSPVSTFDPRNLPRNRSARSVFCPHGRGRFGVIALNPKDCFCPRGQTRVVARPRATHTRRWLELGAVSQPLIPTGERSGLQTHIATESVSLCAPMKLTACVELEYAIRSGKRLAV